VSQPAHRRQHGVGHAHDAEQVDVEQGLNLADRGLLGAAQQADPGVVDQDIDPAGLCEHGRDEGIDRLIVGHVARQHGHSVRAVAGRPAACPEDGESRLRQGFGAGSTDAG
jgi:hypothetical protein